MFTKGRVKGLVLILTFVLLMSSVAMAAPVHKDIFTEVSGENIYNHIAELVYADDENPYGIDNARVTAFEGEWKAADYIHEQFESYGLEVERQKFPVSSFLSFGAEVTMTGSDREFTAGTLTFSPPTKGITAEVVYVGKGLTARDFQESVKGKIALIERGDITFYEKAQNAAAAGAIGAIIFNNAAGTISGTLGNPPDIPVVALTRADGLYLVDLLNRGQLVELTIVSDTKISNSFSQNVIGTLKADRGNTKKAQTIVIGAHYDAVDCPGANDNASGTAALMEVARVLSTKKLAYNIKFIAFGAEEIGLVGAAEYVKSLSDDELEDTVAMINMDMVGIGNRMGIMTVNRNTPSFVADLAEVYIQEFGHEYRRGASSASDHAPFEAAGIPVVFLNYGPDPYYHTDEDSLDKISKDNLYNMATLVTAMTYDMARTPMPNNISSLRNRINKYKFQNDEIPVE